MKKILITAITLGGLFIASCSSDPCKDKSAVTLCSGKGTLTASGSNCVCNCNAGYTGTDCSQLIMTTVIGTFTLTSTASIGGSANARTGTTTIVQDGSSVDRIKITNLNQFLSCTNGGTTSDIICYAVLTNATTITLDETIQCGYVFRGTGTKQSDGSWFYKYTATTGSSVYTCESTLKK